MRKEEINKEQKSLLSIECIFFFSEGQFSFKKKNLLRKALALHTDNG